MRKEGQLLIYEKRLDMQRTLRIAALVLLTAAALSSCGTLFDQCAAYAETPTAELR